MGEALTNDSLQIRSAEEAADQLVDARNGDSAPSFEPTDLQAAGAAVRRLGKRFNDLPGAIAEALNAAKLGEFCGSVRLFQKREL